MAQAVRHPDSLQDVNDLRDLAEAPTQLCRTFNLSVVHESGMLGSLGVLNTPNTRIIAHSHVATQCSSASLCGESHKLRPESHSVLLSGILSVITQPRPECGSVSMAYDIPTARRSSCTWSLAHCEHHLKHALTELRHGTYSGCDWPDALKFAHLPSTGRSRGPVGTQTIYVATCQCHRENATRCRPMAPIRYEYMGRMSQQACTIPEMDIRSHLAIGDVR